MHHPPTVVLDENCHGLQHLIREFAPTCLFRRRAGYLSDPSGATEELHEVLLAGLLPAPYILVSPSFGAFTALLYAARYPSDVAGLVLVDPSHPRQGPVALAVLPPAGPDLPPSLASFRAFLAGFGPVWDRGCRQVSTVVSVGDIPLIVLAAGRQEAPIELSPDIYATLIRDRHTLLAEYAKLSTRGELQVVAGIGHCIATEAPLIVRDAILQLVARARAMPPHKLLQPTPSSVTPPAVAGSAP